MTTSGSFSADKLREQNRQYHGTGGVSHDPHNQSMRFVPAFLDTESGKVFLSRNPDGTIACMHLLNCLPDYLIMARDAKGRVMSVKASLLVGFERDGRFYTRAEAAAAVAAISN